MIIIVAQATGTTDKLSKHNVTKGVSSPAIWVSSSDLLRLFPAQLLHAVRETSRICSWIWRWNLNVPKENCSFFLSQQFTIQNRGRGCGGGLGSSSGRRRRARCRCRRCSSLFILVWSHFDFGTTLDKMLY